ncbi:MAG: hypothetical protein IH901_03790 [Proteobacteria bacterium]|nr:hypothetical protein [Pseudomonadota bacterium]
MKETISIIGSYASMVALFFTSNFNFSGQGILFWVVLVFLILSIVATLIFEGVNFFQKRGYAPQSPKINKFLRKWLLKGGNCAIFTRDMTWGEDEEIYKILEQKAKKNELNLFLPKENKLSKKLKSKGASIYLTNNLLRKPRSRFTVINWEKDGAKIAVGRLEKEKHVIRIYARHDHPLFAVAEDLLELASSYANKTK